MVTPPSPTASTATTETARRADEASSRAPDVASTAPRVAERDATAVDDDTATVAHVDDGDQEKQAKDIFRQQGAHDISSTSEASVPKESSNERARSNP